MLKKALHLTLIANCLLQTICLSQSVTEVIDINNIRGVVSSDGYLFNDPPNFISGGLEVPNGSGKHPLYAANLWMGGLDAMGALHVSAQTYKQIGTDYWSGPLSPNGSAYNPGNWNLVWKISRTEINNHIAQYNQMGYTMPSSIANWPGSQYNSINQIFAPFVDVNNNGIYDPSYGDYPNVPGDETLYLMFNDSYSAHTETGGAPVGAEIYAMIFAYNSTGITALDHTVFVRQTIRNRSSNNFHDFYVGMFNDFELGELSDDFMGTDVGRNLVYVVNADNMDGTGTGNSYGANPPAFGMRMLSHNLAHSMYYNNDASVTGNPAADWHFYQYLRSRWKDGSPLTYGGSGYGGTTPVNYVFPGNTDPMVTSPAWDDSTYTDKRIVASTGPFNLNPGGYITFDVAYVFARGTAGNSLPELDQASEIAANFYQSVLSTSVKENYNNGFSFYPNPASNRLFVKTSPDQNSGRADITDISGQKVYCSTSVNGNVMEIDISGLASGTYILSLSDGENAGFRLFIKE